MVAFSDGKPASTFPENALEPIGAEPDPHRMTVLLRQVAS
jgi:hypothetical protein